MIYIRSLLFSIYFPIWTIIVSTVGSPTLLISPNWVLAVGKIWSTGVLWGLRVFCNIHYEIRGWENLPKEPCIIASKHQSAWDTVTLLRDLAPVSYVLKAQLTLIPFYGLYVARMGMVPINRSGSAKTIKKIIRRSQYWLDKGRNIIIFPEGTRTKPGEHKPYQPGVAAMYKMLDAPVVPVALNSGLYWGKRQFLKKPGTIIVQILPPIEKGLNKEQFMKKIEDVIETGTNDLVTNAHQTSAQ